MNKKKSKAVKKVGKISKKDRKILQNHKDYGKLVCLLDEMCHTAIEESNLHWEDIITALNTVGMYWFAYHIECEYDLKSSEERKNKK